MRPEGIAALAIGPGSSPDWQAAEEFAHGLDGPQGERAAEAVDLLQQVLCVGSHVLLNTIELAGAKIFVIGGILNGMSLAQAVWYLDHVGVLSAAGFEVVATEEQSG